MRPIATLVRGMSSLISAMIGEIAATAVRKLRATSRIPTSASERPAQRGRRVGVGTATVY
jgi:hypothetical protein